MTADEVTKRLIEAAKSAVWSVHRADHARLDRAIKDYERIAKKGGSK